MVNVWKVLALVLVIVGLLVAPLVALGQEAGVDVETFHVLTADEFLTRLGVAALIIGVAVRFLRQFLPGLANGSTFAKRGTALACIVFGVALGAAHVAPAAAPGLAGSLLGGFVAGGLAFFGAAILGSKARLEDGTTGEG